MAEIEPMPKLYGIWRSMRNRCSNPNNKDFHNYGGRGIYVCKEWDKYPVFQEWAVKNGYKENMTLDRIDNNGNYDPKNCRWVTRKEQALNRRPKRGTPVNGGWHDAKLDPPPTNKERDCHGNLCFSERVLTAVRHEYKDGTGWTDVWTDQYTKGGTWLCADIPDDDITNTVLYWMPLPKIPEN